EPAANVDFFEQKIRPVLVEQCYKCHSAEAKPAKGGLRLDSREAFLKGGDSGPAVVAGRPDASLLIKAIRHTDEALKMPPKQRLSGAVVADFEKWVALGAPYPAAAGRSAGSAQAEARRHWAFQPVRN